MHPIDSGCSLHTSVIQASYDRMQPACERIEASYTRTTACMQGRMQPACRSVNPALTNKFLNFVIRWLRMVGFQIHFKVVRLMTQQIQDKCK